jgi:hypothetical protein
MGNAARDGELVVVVLAAFDSCAAELRGCHHAAETSVNIL